MSDNGYFFCSKKKIIKKKNFIYFKAKLPATLEVPNDMEMNSTIFGAIVAAGIAAAITAAIVTLVIVRRHAKSREKLAGLATPDPEASKDYQDLCRVRMQAKQPTEKQEPWRLSSSRENEGNNFVPDRSSTSSWTEEPTFSNMDISTGHMVLVNKNDFKIYYVKNFFFFPYDYLIDDIRNYRVIWRIT